MGWSADWKVDTFCLPGMKLGPSANRIGACLPSSPFEPFPFPENKLEPRFQQHGLLSPPSCLAPRQGERRAPGLASSSPFHSRVGSANNFASQEPVFSSYSSSAHWISNSNKVQGPLCCSPAFSTPISAETVSEFAESSRTFSKWPALTESKKDRLWADPASRRSVSCPSISGIGLLNSIIRPTEASLCSCLQSSPIVSATDFRELAGNLHCSPAQSTTIDLMVRNLPSIHLENRTSNVQNQSIAGSLSPRVPIVDRTQIYTSWEPRTTALLLENANSGAEARALALPVNQTSSMSFLTAQSTKRTLPKATRSRPTRPRNKWTEDETTALLHGVAEYGIGNWKKILVCSEYVFRNRTAVDLKDRFRTCCPLMYGRQANSAFLEDGFLIVAENERVGSESEDELDEIRTKAASELGTRRRRTNTDRKTARDLAKLGITKLFAHTRRRKRRPFSFKEDKSILIGFGKHGPQWNSIRNDGALGLSERSRTDLRDRFRNRYPDLFRLSRTSSFTREDAEAIVKGILTADTVARHNSNTETDVDLTASPLIEERLKSIKSGGPFPPAQADLLQPKSGVETRSPGTPWRRSSTTSAVTVQSLLNPPQLEDAHPRSERSPSFRSPGASDRTLSVMSVAAIVSPLPSEPIPQLLGADTKVGIQKTTPHELRPFSFPTFEPGRGSLSYIVPSLSARLDANQCI